MARKNKINKKENLPIIMVVLLVLLLLFSFGGGFSYMWGMMFFGSVFMILTLIFIVWLIVYLTQQR